MYTGIDLDKNFLIVICLTLGIVTLCVIYLKVLSVMLKNKNWKIALGIFFAIFMYTLVQMILDLYLDTPVTTLPYTRLLMLKLVTMAHGIYFLSVEMGHSQGVRKTTVSLKENEVLIVLTTLSLSNIMINIHTLSWNFERGLIALVFNVLFSYLVVNVVFYLGEIKYYFIYAAPMIIVFGGMSLLSSGYSSDKMTPFLQSQMGIILTMILSAIYLFVKMQYEVVESRSVIRKIEALDVEELGLE